MVVKGIFFFINIFFDFPFFGIHFSILFCVNFLKIRLLLFGSIHVYSVRFMFILFDFMFILFDFMFILFDFMFNLFDFQNNLVRIQNNLVRFENNLVRFEFSLVRFQNTKTEWVLRHPQGYFSTF